MIGVFLFLFLKTWSPALNVPMHSAIDPKGYDHAWDGLTVYSLQSNRAHHHSRQNKNVGCQHGRQR